MDPLSFAANIIAVCQSASVAAQYLRKLISLKHVPEQLLQLLNELSDVCVVLYALQDTCDQLASLDDYHDLLNQVKRKVNAAYIILNDLNTIIETRLIIASDSTSLQNPLLPGKISLKSWFKFQPQIRNISQALRETRQNIAQDLTVLTALHNRSISLEVQHIAQTSNQLVSLLNDLKTSQNERDIEAEVATAKEYIEEYNDKKVNTQPFMQIGTTLCRETRCSFLCMCHCHNVSTSRTPEAMNKIIGTLFIGYSGLPLLSSRTCNEKSCLRQKEHLVKINYYFPRWFLPRMVVFHSGWSSLTDFRMNMRTPRLVPLAADIFLFSEQGQTSSVRDLFVGSLASPFDISDDLGLSALHLAVTWNHPEMCKLLLEQGADPHLEDKTGSSPVDHAWNYILTGESQRWRAVIDVFHSLLDPEEYILKQRFSVVHRIVLNLVPLDLEDYLKVTTSDINSKSSTGQTPLIYAVLRGDLSTIRILFKYGADVRIADDGGNTAIHHAASAPHGNSCEVIQALLDAFLKVSVAESQHPDGSADLPLGLNHQQSIDASLAEYVNKFADISGTPLDIAIIKGRTPNAKLLLENKADIEKADWNDSTPLLQAIQYNHHPLVSLLLELGANVHAMDRQRTGILHYAAITADLKTLKILAEAKIEGVDSQSRDENGSTPLQLFENDRSKFVTEDSVIRSQSRAHFELILWNARNLSADILYPKIADCGFEYSEPIEEYETSQDEFFDAKSVLEVVIDGGKRDE